MDLLVRALLLGSLLSGCSKSEPAPSKLDSAPRASAAAQHPSAAPAGSAAQSGASTKALDGNAPIFHPEAATDQAPETYKVEFDTTKGKFVVGVTRAWAPLGADRFYNLVKLGFYDDQRFYRAVKGFMVQFGVSGNPAVNGAWYRATLKDDPAHEKNLRGTLSFAMAGPNTRSVQVFINSADKNRYLDSQGFVPFGRVTEGQAVVDALDTSYGDGPPRGTGPDASRAGREGNAYLDKEFPKLDRIKTARLLGT